MCSRILCGLAALLFCSCAYQGTIVQKEARSLPLAYTLGTDVMCKFELRDGAGNVHWQLVSLAVYNTYEVGDYFNDVNPVPPHHGSGKDDKDVHAPWIPQFEVIPARTQKFEPIPVGESIKPRCDAMPASAPAAGVRSHRTANLRVAKKGSRKSRVAKHAPRHKRAVATHHRKHKRLIAQR